MKFKFGWLVLCVLIVALFVTWCKKNSETNEEQLSQSFEYCINNGWQIEVGTTSDGTEHNVCVFEDWSFCDELDFFNGSCTSWYIPSYEEID